MNEATPESQAAVVTKALKAYGFAASQGKKHFSNKVVVRHANPDDRGQILAISCEYAKGFTVDIIKTQTYFLVTVHTRPQLVAEHREPAPIDHGGNAPYE